MSATRPAPHVLRNPTEADAEAVAALLGQRERADLGHEETTLEDVRAEWAEPGFDLAADAWVAEADGAALGYASLIADDLMVVVHPDAAGRGLGTQLREAGERRAEERGTRVLRQFVAMADTRARVLLLDAGWWPVHHYFRLRVPLSRAPDPPDALVRTFDAERDLEAVWHVVQGAYAPVEGFLPQTLEGWRATTLDKPGWDPARWLVRHDAEGLGGAGLGERGPRATGLVHTLAVAERARDDVLVVAFACFRIGHRAHADLFGNERVISGDLCQ